MARGRDEEAIGEAPRRVLDPATPPRCACWRVGAVMVYSASSAESLLRARATRPSTSSATWSSGCVGLGVLHFLARHGTGGGRGAHGVAAGGLVRRCCVAVMMPGVGVTVNGATRWLGAGPLQFQPSELLKVSLVLYAAQLLAARPERVETIEGLFKPLLLVVARRVRAADEAAGHGHGDGGLLRDRRAADRRRHADPQPRADRRRAGGAALLLALAEPYRRERLTSVPRPVLGRGRLRASRRCRR